jgi:hypothetical protein
MWWQPSERDGDNNYWNENPAARGIFALADSNAATPREAVTDRTRQGQNHYTSARRIGKERSPIAPTPNDERKKRQCAADSKSEVLNGVIQKS